MRTKTVQVGDPVVYYKPKASTAPSPLAQELRPHDHGEGYRYIIKKYWRVVKVEQDSLLITTRRGKLLNIRCDDRQLRKALFWEKFFLRHRFPQAQTATTDS